MHGRDLKVVEILRGMRSESDQSRPDPGTPVGRRPGALQETVGRNIRAYRQQHGMSQEALAAELGVHRTYMGGVERGQRNLTLRSLERIASALGLDPRDLLIDGVESD